MRRNDENRAATSRSQFPQIIKILQPGNLFASHIEHKDMGAAQAHLCRGNKENAHCCRIGEHFLSIEDRVMQRDRENAKSESARAFQQFVRGIIDRVFRIIQRMDMKIDFDPFLVRACCRDHAHARFEKLIADHADFIRVRSYRGRVGTPRCGVRSAQRADPTIIRRAAGEQERE